MEMRKVFKACLSNMMKDDEKIVVLDADLAKADGTSDLYKEYPDKTFDCGIAEQNMASIAAGLASYGYKPYISSFTPFATRRICDQIAISICYSNMNVKIVGTDPGVSAELNGGTHMSMEDIGVLRSIPRMVIFEPVDEIQLKKAMPVIDSYVGPLYIRMFRKETPIVFDEDYTFDLFKADLLKEGKDITILVSGLMTRDTLDVANELESIGINCEVINVHTIKPIDSDTIIKSAKKTGVVLTIENHNIIGGLYSAACEALGEYGIPITNIGVKDRFGEVGKMPYLREVMGMTKDDIANKIKYALTLKK